MKSHLPAEKLLATDGCGGKRVFSIVKALRDCPPHAAVDSLTLCTHGRHEVDSVDSAATTKSKLEEGWGWERN